MDEVIFICSLNAATELKWCYLVALVAGTWSCSAWKWSCRGQLR